MLPLLEHHDRERFAIHCYATSTVDDRGTAAMRAQASAWHDVAGLDDEALAARIRADRIDVLVDLVGHCPGNSLHAFARRAAPVQVTWLDYVDTTAVPAMDVLVGDALHMPLDGDQRFTEALVRMARPRFVYRLATPPPPVAPPPIARARHADVRLLQPPREDRRAGGRGVVVDPAARCPAHGWC